MKFSIIIPIYNIQFKYLERCIDSIKSQTYHNWECILVDDGSKDEYIYKDYYLTITKNNKFKYFYKNNEGTGITRDFGFKKSNGDLIWFIDPDDYISNNKALESIRNIFLKNNIDFLNFNYLTNKKINNENIIQEKIIINDGKNIWRNWQTTWRNVYSKNFLKKNNIRNQNYNIYFEDVFWDLVTKSTFNKIITTNQCFIFYETKRRTSVINITKNKLNNVIKLITKNIYDAYIFVIKNEFSLDNFFSNLFYYWFYIPYLNNDIKNELLIYVKNNNYEIDFKSKLIIFILKSKIFTIAYKILTKILCFFWLFRIK